MCNDKGKKKAWTMQGTIVRASRIQEFQTKHGKPNHSAVLHIREDVNDADSAQVAVKVSGELCNYAGCVGARVVVEYIVRVFEFAKNGIQMLGNDVYATNIRMI